MKKLYQFLILKYKFIFTLGIIFANIIIYYLKIKYDVKMNPVPIVREYYFDDNNVIDGVTYTFTEIPNGRYMAFFDSEIINWVDNDYNGKIAFVMNNQPFISTYLFNKCNNIHESNFVEVTDNVINFIAEARNCNNYIYNKMKICLIPI